MEVGVEQNRLKIPITTQNNDPFPGNCESVQLCRQAHCILLRYSRHLEVWKLGTFKEPLTGEGHIPLSSDPIQLVRLEAKEGGLIASAALSDDAHWLVYSTNSQVYCHRLFLEDGVPRLQKVDMSAEHSDVAQRVVFTLDGTQVILATTSGSIKILNLLEDHIERVISFNPHVDKLLKGPVKLLAVSGDGCYLVAGDRHANIVVWSLASLQYHLSLPKHRCSPTALAIQSSTNNLVVVYADHKVVEVNLKTGKFSNFSKLLSGQMPTQWSSRCFPVNNVTFDPRNDNIIILHDDTTICIIDKDKDLPLAEAKIPRLESSGMSDGVDSSNQSYPRTSSPQNAFHFIKKYKHLVHLEWLVGEELVAVEVSPASLAEKLPPSLKQKKYGM
uniref:Cirhin n=1 Tax=Timema tahoe TaxID=61484 RepID=A0A7R9IL52_9NEOP|nr:unnamed protein product [Timema tahoe]